MAQYSMESSPDSTALLVSSCAFSVSPLLSCPPFYFGLSDYHYVTREEMQASIDHGDFIENAEFSGNLYGTSKAAVQAVQAKNLICILDIDMQGVKNIKRTDLNPIYVSIQPPSMEVLVSIEGGMHVKGFTGSTFVHIVPVSSKCLHAGPANNSEKPL